MRPKTSLSRSPGNWASVHRERWAPVLRAWLKIQTHPPSQGLECQRPVKQPTTCNFQDLVQAPLIPHKCLRSWKNRVWPRQVKQGEGYVSVINQCHLQRRLRVCPHHTLPVPVMGNSQSLPLRTGSSQEDSFRPHESCREPAMQG